jgi:hypothetical protein
VRPGQARCIEGRCTAIAATPLPTSWRDADAFSRLAQYQAVVTENLLLAARGEPHDPIWDEVGGRGDGLNTTATETVTAMRALGPYHVVGTTFEAEAIGEDGAGEWHHLRARFFVGADGRVAIHALDLDHGPLSARGTSALHTAASPLAGAVLELINRLGACVASP